MPAKWKHSNTDATNIFSLQRHSHFAAYHTFILFGFTSWRTVFISAEAVPSILILAEMPFSFFPLHK